MRRNDEERKDLAALRLERKKITFNLVLLLAASFVVLLAVITAAWFASNKKVKGEDMTVTAADIGFELASSGSAVRHSSYWTKADTSYLEGEDGSGQDKDGNAVTYKATGVTTHKIMQRITTANDAAVEPGSYGKMEFYVIPKQDGDITVQFTLSVRGFYEKDANNLVDIATLDSTNNNGLDQNQILTYQDALRYLQGHVFFFQTEGDPNDATNAYCFKNPIENNTFTLEIQNAVADKLYPVTVFWIWPETIGQLVLKNNNSHLMEGIPVVENVTGAITGTDKEKVISMVKANKTNILKDLQAGNDHVNDMIDDAERYYSMLDNWYNLADQSIGEYVDYFMVEVNATLEN